ncbi:NACHT, LRR and PYD domains-containing protein 12-like isoform X2 [Myxocyprinus asiaticus]|nr:NACHT, LRR and PYD domains-containing protein 12-like isoform X2 [Myxocyprinus asiaticus]
MVKYKQRKLMKKRYIKKGNNIQTHFGNVSQQNNNFALHNTNNNAVSPGQPSFLNPSHFNVNIDQKDGGAILAPNILGTNITGDVHMNLHMQPVPHTTSINRDEILQNIKNKIKSRMLKDSERILEGSTSKSASLNKIYTQLFIISDESDPINKEHEIWQIETSHDLNTSMMPVINYNEILQPPMDESRTMKTILTKGIAGIGKTVTVQKFILDWASGEANKDIDFVLLFPFRDLNLLVYEKSLFDLVCNFNPEFKEATDIPEWIFDRKVLFIFDGLDEYKNPLNFQNTFLSNVTQKATVDILLTNLLRGKLLPSAHLWITSRPVAAGQLPNEIFKQGYITQIRGFNNEQKEEYFKRRFEDPKQTQEVISHIKSHRSLWISCHIPLFCWISSVVLGDVIEGQNNDRIKNIPSSLTEMYIHYLLNQTRLSHRKYGGNELAFPEVLKNHKNLILKLAVLAYWQLKAQNVVFNEKDLEEYEITVDEASQYPGVITCVSKCEFGYFQTKLFSFIHLSVQEFFAALFAFHKFLSEKQDSLECIKAKKGQRDLSNFFKGVINEALQSKSGHLDLFNCFLFGISCDSSIKILEGLLPQSRGSSLDGHKKVKMYIKSLKRKGLSAERCISLVRCLVELKDMSFKKEMQELERSRSKEPLTLFQCMLLAYQFVCSDMNHDEFDLRKYNMTVEGFRRFSPAITCFKKALLKGSDITEEHCDIMTFCLKSPNSQLTHLDLSHNGLGLSGLEKLFKAFCDPNCQIQTLNLSHNNLQTQDVKVIGDMLSGPNISLRILDLSDNDLDDPGAEILSYGLQSTNCHLEILRLSGCQIKEKGFNQLVSSLQTNSSCLRELDLRYNNLGDFGQESLLPSVRISKGGLCSDKPGLYKYAVPLTFDPQTANEFLYLSNDNTVVTRQRKKRQPPVHDERFDQSNQVLCSQPLKGCCCFTMDVTGTDVYVGVACKSIERKGQSNRVLLGHNNMSWSLCCSKNECVAYHNQRTVSLPHAEPIGKLCVFLDQEAGTLSFYRLSPKRILYTFDANLPENQDLYAAFRIQEPDSSVILNC